MPISPAKLSDRLQAEREKTLAFFSGLPEETWSLKLYSEGQHWTVRQMFVHLVQAEQAILRLMRAILNGGEGSPQDFRLDEYNERKVQEIEALALEELLARFGTYRDETIRWVETLSVEDLSLEGRHPFLGIAPLEEMIKLMYRHTQLHQRDVRRLMDERA